MKRIETWTNTRTDNKKQHISQPSPNSSPALLVSVCGMSTFRIRRQEVLGTSLQPSPHKATSDTAGGMGLLISYKTIKK